MEADRARSRRAGDPPTVLLVEDNDPFRQALSEILRSRGFQVLPAGSAAEGAELLDAADLVLLDGMLPGRDGWAFCQEIRERVGPGLPVVMITARAEPEMRLRSVEVGADAFLVKPFRIGDLLRCMEPLVRRSDPD